VRGLGVAAAVLVAVAAIGGSIGPNDRRSEAQRTHRPLEGAQKLQHLVFIVQENR
jgi:hypothetical protein